MSALIVAFWIGILVRGMAPVLRSVRAILADFELSLLQPKLPQLYPRQSEDGWIAPWPAAELERLAALPLLRVAPFAAPSDAPELQQLALALARLLIRELQVAQGIAVRAPAACPLTGVARPDALSRHAREHALGGELWRSDAGLHATLRLAEPGGQLRERVLVAPDARALLAALRAECLGWFAGGETAQAALRFAWPERDADYVELGRGLWTAAHERDVPTRDDGLLELRRRVPGSGVAAALLSAEELQHKLDALAQEPGDPELALSIHFDRADIVNGEQHALQFLRSALESAPTHAAAQLRLARIAPQSDAMIGNAELACALAPDDTRAIDHYLELLGHKPDARARRIALASATVAAAPADPAAYYHLIAALRADGQYARALEVARTLMDYLRPLHPLTRTRFAANADPAAELERTIAELEQRAAA